MYEWPLIIATLSSAVLFALSFSAWNHSRIVAPVIYIAILVATGLMFVFYYRRSSKQDLVMTNLRSSPRVREVLSFAFFSVFSTSAMLTGIEIFWILSFISGILLLVAIDTFYANSDKRYTIRYHSAQVFLTGLMMTSFLIDEPLPFIFISLLKTLYLMICKIFRQVNVFEKIFNLIYIFYLVFVSWSLFTTFSDVHFLKIMILLVIFELGMRIIFYFDLTLGGKGDTISR